MMMPKLVMFALGVNQCVGRIVLIALCLVFLYSEIRDYVARGIPRFDWHAVSADVAQSANADGKIVINYKYNDRVIEAKAVQWRSSFPGIGQQVTVYVDPSDPGDALERPPVDKSRIIGAVALIVAIWISLFVRRLF